MKMSTCIRDAVERRLTVAWDDEKVIGCPVCDELADRTGERSGTSCAECPVSGRVAPEMVEPDSTGGTDCTTWAEHIFNGDEDAYTAALEIALACEIAGD